MSRIASNMTGIERALLNRMAEANAQAAVSALRLATRQKVNYPRDNPSAFVQLSGLQDSLNVVNAAMANVNVASSMITQTQTVLGDVADQLDIIRTELQKDEDHALTAEQRAESQAKIDAAIEEINSLAVTEIDGRRMLEGSADFAVTGRDPNEIAKVTVYSTGGVERTISGQVLTAGTQATLTYTGASGKTTDAATFTLTGTLGSTTITVTDEENLTDVAAAINQYSHETGVTASVNSDTLTFTSVGYGTEAKAQVQVNSGTFVVAGGDSEGADYGTNGTALINGQSVTANASDGNTFTINANGFRVDVQAKAGLIGSFDTMTVAADAISFDLTGRNQNNSTLALPSVLAVSLGGYSGTLNQLQSGGTYSGLSTNTSQALRIVGEAIGQVTRIQARADGFYSAAVESSSALLTDLQTDLGDAIDSINLVDEVEETSREQFYLGLADNAASSLMLLSEQRGQIVNLIKHIAGLD